VSASPCYCNKAACKHFVLIHSVLLAAHTVYVFMCVGIYITIAFKLCFIIFHQDGPRKQRGFGLNETHQLIMICVHGIFFCVKMVIRMLKGRQLKF
jgi:hypothetical protein